MIRFVRKLAVLPVHASGHDGPEFRSLHETLAVDAYRELFGLLVEWVSIRGLTVPVSGPQRSKQEEESRQNTCPESQILHQTIYLAGSVSVKYSILSRDDVAN